eukprot:SM000066S20424  [mRNA]  locus=s66:236717:241882:+ [translate_table: standard]
MMGYANPAQLAGGVHLRLRARALVAAEARPGGRRVAFVSLDACMASQVVALEAFKRLKGRYGGLYTEENVVISGIHTHAGPGGYLGYVLYIITSLGFVRQSFDALVDGIERSIVLAHNNLRPGTISVAEGELLEANINRSPSAYLANPADERAQYEHDVDKTMTLLRITDDEWGDVGAFSWFPVHCTSMSRLNSLISGDNKGAASRFMEDWFETERSGSRSRARQLQDAAPAFDLAAAQATAAAFKARSGEPTAGTSSMLHRVRRGGGWGGRPPFVAAFAQSNEGDVSPNVLGAFCNDTGLPCDFNHSTCNGRNELCYGRGPAYPGTDFESTRIIGERQFHKAKELFEAAEEGVQGPIDFRQTWLDMTNVEVDLGGPKAGDSGATKVKTCAAAVGFGFAAGTTDGPGAFDFKQGETKGNPFWKLVGGLIKKPTEEQVACQHPKPILLDTGESHLPYDWAPAILPISLLRVGLVIICAVPAEFTTMAGRRLRDAVRETLQDEDPDSFDNGTRVVIAGLSNSYSQYVATREEYGVQRYEGASTLYGPHTLAAYIQEFQKLAKAMARGKAVSRDVRPPQLLGRQIGLLPPVIADAAPLGTQFGDVKVDVPAEAPFVAGDIVEAVFHSSCPRNSLLTEGTFALVERFREDTAVVQEARASVGESRREGVDSRSAADVSASPSGTWIPEYDDDDWSLKFLWARPRPLAATSTATLRWEVPDSAPPGVYRFRHYNAYKGFLGPVRHFTGTSSAFVVAEAGSRS